MRHLGHPIIAALAALVLLGIAAPASATDRQPDADTVMRYDPLALTTRNVTRLALHSPSQHTREVMAVFKMRLDRIFPELRRHLLRPYLLGGQSALRTSPGNTVGEHVPGMVDSVALHIGGGAELRLRERLFLSMDVGEVMHSGPLSEQSYQTYKLGLVYDF